MNCIEGGRKEGGRLFPASSVFLPTPQAYGVDLSSRSQQRKTSHNPTTFGQLLEIHSLARGRRKKARLNTGGAEEL